MPEVEFRAPDTLTAAPWNPRRIDPGAFGQLVESLAHDPAFAVERPVLATTDGTIYAGHMRARAIGQLIEEGRWPYPGVPTLLADVDDQTARARSQRDNVRAGQWDEALLSDLLSDLAALGFDPQTFGLKERYVDRLLRARSEGDAFEVRRYEDGQHGRTPAERRATSSWVEQGIAKIALHYELADWRETVRRFDDIRARRRIGNNADALQTLLREARAKAEGATPT